MKKVPFLLILAMTCWFIFGCSRPWASADGLAALPTEQQTPVFTPIPSQTPTQPLPVPSITPTPLPDIAVRFDPGTPGDLRQSILKLDKIRGAPVEDQANLRIGVGNGKEIVGQWVFALVAPFPTLEDGVSLADLISTWQGKKVKSFEGHGLILGADTKAVFEKKWGTASASIRTVEPADLSGTAWKEKTTWAILPFEEIQPRWKVLRIDGRSPFDQDFQPAQYGLTAAFGIDGNASALERFTQSFPQLAASPITNHDPSRMTVLIMTGTTALVRGSAWFMQQKGLLFPGTEIRDWLRAADITHISNEVSFDPECPTPDPNDPNLRFCSQPQNIRLLEDVGTDVVELTGNHLNDFGSEWLSYTIDMYRQRNWLFYGAGVNQEQARKPVTIEHNGNRLAFIGCNPAGPKPDWATADKPGTADCDYPEMNYLEAEIRRLKADGYLPIVTFQYFESVDPRPLPIHYRDFRRMADAGAVIVSGSQAHIPQAMELRNDGFIHYGIGNLFFDQMDTFWPDTKDEFIDRHIFYNGKYLGVELLTARLVEYVKPRPMTTSERETLLRRIFDVSGWSQSSSNEWRIAP